MRYTTVNRLRAESFIKADFPDARAEEIIEEASQILTDILGSWFVPFRNKKGLDGGGSSIVFYPNRIPFLEVLSLSEVASARADGRGSDDNEFLVETGGEILYSASDYVVRGRYIETKYDKFFDGRSNVIIDAYTGWLEEFDTENRNYSINKTIHNNTIIIPHLSREATLDSVLGFNKRNIIMFERNDSSRELLATAIITDIDFTTKKIKFDRLYTKNEVSIPVDAIVITFGCVPKLIERATLLLFKKLFNKINTEDYEDSAFNSKLKSEKTDRYQYTLFGSGEGGGIGITGDPLIDSQLDKFSHPINIDLV
jgi:hypothetical protein